MTGRYLFSLAFLSALRSCWLNKPSLNRNMSTPTPAYRSPYLSVAPILPSATDVLLHVTYILWTHTHAYMQAHTNKHRDFALWVLPLAVKEKYFLYEKAKGHTESNSSLSGWKKHIKHEGGGMCGGCWCRWWCSWLVSIKGCSCDCAVMSSKDVSGNSICQTVLSLAIITSLIVTLKILLLLGW